MQDGTPASSATSAAGTSAPRRSPSVLGIVLNALLGIAELCGVGVWLIITLSVGALTTSRAHPGMEPDALAWVGLPGLVPFGLAVVCNGLGIWKGIRGSTGASLGLCAGAFLLGLIPWGIVFWVVSKIGRF